MRKLDLNQLQQGIPGITPAVGNYLSEAVICALVKNGHQGNVELSIEGDWQGIFTIEWRNTLPEEMAKSWNDDEELVEYAAIGIAIPLILHLTKYTEFKRAQKGGGMDYWLGRKDKNGFPILEALLEVSGIMVEKPGNTVNGRVGIKKKRIKNSPLKDLPSYIVVVEFSQPKSKFISL